MKNSIKSIVLVGLTLSLIIGFLLEVTLVSAQLVVVIDSDTTWTKADSPHELTGPVLVNQGVTLTIEAGATVNLKGYDMRVNGTLRVIGTSDEMIYLNNGGTIEFTQFSTVWDEQSGFGCIIKNVLFDSGILSINSSPKITGNSIYGIDIYEGSPIISQNIITGGMTVQGGTPEITYNTLACNFHVIGGTSSILYNTINSRITINAGSATLEHNKFADGIHVDSRGGAIKIVNNVVNVTGDYAVIYVQGVPATITNNIITGNNVSRNVLTGGSIFEPEYTTVYIVNNEGIKILSPYDCYISGNTISTCSFAIDGFTSGSLTIEGNMISKNMNGIYLEEKATPFEPFTNSVLTIRNNIVTNSVDIGVQFNHPSPNILSNTITNNSIGIRINKLTGYSSSPTIRNNNIYSNEYNIKTKVTDNINATYNWWGTTDSEAINLKIYDSKYSFDIGTVSVNPFLTEPPQETPTADSSEIPEFPSWLVLPMFLLATLAVMIARKKNGGYSA